MGEKGWRRNKQKPANEQWIKIQRDFTFLFLSFAPLCDFCELSLHPSLWHASCIIYTAKLLYSNDDCGQTFIKKDFKTFLYTLAPLLLPLFLTESASKKWWMFCEWKKIYCSWNCWLVLISKWVNENGRWWRFYWRWDEAMFSVSTSSISQSRHQRLEAFSLSETLRHPPENSLAFFTAWSSFI